MVLYGEEVDLPWRAHEVVLLLALRAGGVVTREELSSWGRSRHGRREMPVWFGARVQWLRKAGVPIRCVFGVGYSLMLGAGDVEVL